jgi:hypothetical protein
MKEEDFNLFKPDPTFDKMRSKASSEILNILKVFLKKNPSLRFGQALLILKVVEDGENFAMIEPMVVLDRMKSTDAYKDLASKGNLNV